MKELRRGIGVLAALFLGANFALAQFSTTLQPSTINDFEAYAKKVEQELSTRGKDGRPFLIVDEDPAERNKVLHGDVVIQPGATDGAVGVSNGVIHEWVGAVFIPHTTVAAVMRIVNDFDSHSRIYPEVIRSKLLSRKGQDASGYWRVQQKESVLTVVLDITQHTHQQQVGPGKWDLWAYADHISEVKDAGTPKEQKLPEGEGYGFLWRLYGYWSFEAVNDGVVAECRTLSLSRTIPAALSWAVKPFLTKVPRESLRTTMEKTRAAAAEERAQNQTERDSS